MFILMIKDTLLPTVQKTHIGKYRTFPGNLQTVGRNSQRQVSVLGPAPAPVWEGSRKSSALLMTYLVRVQRKSDPIKVLWKKRTHLYTTWKGTNFFF